MDRFRLGQHGLLGEAPEAVADDFDFLGQQRGQALAPLLANPLAEAVPVRRGQLGVEKSAELRLVGQQLDAAGADAQFPGPQPQPAKQGVAAFGGETEGDAVNHLVIVGAMPAVIEHRRNRREIRRRQGEFMAGQLVMVELAGVEFAVFFASPAQPPGDQRELPAQLAKQARGGCVVGVGMRQWLGSHRDSGYRCPIIEMLQMFWCGKPPRLWFSPSFGSGSCRGPARPCNCR